MKTNIENQSFYKFLILWFGGFISAIGTGLSSFGLGIYVLNSTSSISAKAFISLLAFLPGLLLSPFAGVLADRYDRRLLMILGDGLSALGLLYILLSIMGGHIELWQIGLGVTISSVFSSLVSPAFDATITDLLTKDEFTKASGLVQVSGAAKFLISPVLAGLLLTVADIRLLLLIDICTIFFTVVSTLVVRRGLVSRIHEKSSSFFEEFRFGLSTLAQNKGVLALTLMGALITLFIGFIQELSTPVILAFTNEATLGLIITISASGMLVTSLAIGIFPIKKDYVKILCLSLFIAGIFMSGFALRENALIICIFGFLFFTMLPFANTCIDYLIRTNVPNDVQGRIWGFIGIITQLGYVVAYVLIGLLADTVFTPLLIEGGPLAGSIGKIIGVGNGRGTALLIIISGILLSLTAVTLYRIQSVQNLDQDNKKEVGTSV